MAQVKSVNKNISYVVFAGLAALLLVIGILLSGFASSNGSFSTPDFSALIEGYKIILTHPSMIDFDGLKQSGQLGTAFFNSGVLLFIVLAIYRLTKTDLQGVQIAAAMMVVGFSFYGKNPLNIWFPILGVLVHTKVKGKALNTGTALAFFSTALSPIFSQIAFGMTDRYMLEQQGLVPATITAYVVGAALGFLAGYIISVIADHFPGLHRGYVLFNAGFAAGISAMIINSLLKAVGFGSENYRAALYATSMQDVWDGALPDLFANAPHATELLNDPTFNPTYMSAADNANWILGLMLVVCFGYLIIAGITLGGGANYKNLFWHRSKGGNYVDQFGFPSALINMGVVGLFATTFVFATLQGVLAGPVFGCIWTACGFAANGVTVRMYLPTMMGVFIGAFVLAGLNAAVHGEDFFTAGLSHASSRGMLLAAIFSCGLAPVVGEFGFLAGLFAGVVHSILVVNTGWLHGYMSLYNNGLSLSLIATFLHPIYSYLQKWSPGFQPDPDPDI